MALIRFMLAIVVLYGLTLHLVDAINAYLTGGLDEELYIESPKGYDGHGMVYWLLKSLYGLK